MVEPTEKDRRDVAHTRMLLEEQLENNIVASGFRILENALWQIEEILDFCPFERHV